MFSIEFGKNLYLHFNYYKYDDGFAIRKTKSNQGLNGTWEYVFDSNDNGIDKRSVYNFEIKSDSIGKLVYNEYVIVMANKIAKPYSWSSLLGKQMRLVKQRDSRRFSVHNNLFLLSESNLRIGFNQSNDSLEIDFNLDFDGRKTFYHKNDNRIVFINFSESRKPTIKELIPLFNKI